MQDEGHSNHSLLTPRFIITLIFGYLYIQSFILNFKVVRVVCSSLSKQIIPQFPTGLLEAHLVITGIGLTTCSLMSNLQSKEMLVQVSEFFEDSFICGVSLNTALLLWALVPNDSQIDEPFPLLGLVGMVYLSACTVGLFTRAFTYHMKQELAEYKLGIETVSIFGEAIRFLIFHFGIGICISYAITEVYCQIAKIPNPKKWLLRRIKNFRVFLTPLYTYAILFIPYGFWCASYRLALSKFSPPFANTCEMECIDLETDMESTNG